MNIEKWVLLLICGLLILGLGIWLEKRRDKKTKKWYFGGHIDFQYKISVWSIISAGQILIWQGLITLLGINWIPVIGLYVLFTGAYFLYQSLRSDNEASWYNRVIRNKSFAVGLLLVGTLLIALGW